MLDHVFGRPSSNWKRAEALILSLSEGKFRQGSFISHWSQRLSQYIPNSLFFHRPSILTAEQFKPWQIVILSLLGRYLGGRFFLLTFLNAPEVYSRYYNRNFYRATWILTALDAGYWTAMNIRPAFLRQIASAILTVWYLFQADAADIKVRKIRSDCSAKMMRISWEKSTSPLLWAIAFFQRPSIGFIKDLYIARNNNPDELAKYPNSKAKTRIKLYYAGKESQLGHVQKVVLHFPGGGFITMGPENHEEYIRRWARNLGTAVLIASVDYGKAPEFPYPYAIEECFEIYEKICETNGTILGINTENFGGKSRKLQVALAGDSAGGNLVAAVTIKVLETILYPERPNNTPLNLQLTMEQQQGTIHSLKKPDGIMIIYGALNFDMASWIAPDDSHAQLLRHDSETSLSGLMKNYKGKKYHKDILRRASDASERSGKDAARVESFSGLSTPYLSLTSRVAYFNDRIIPPELARAMSLLYLPTNTTVNPATDYYLSPVNAPEEILMEFPRVWMMCGECDPFVDDTVVFAARVRSAIAKKYQNYTDDSTMENTLQGRVSPNRNSSDSDFEYEYGSINRDPYKHVSVKIYAGLSHAYLQMLNFLPEAHHATALTGQWLCEIFELKDRIEARKRRQKKNYRMEMRDEDNIPDAIDLPLGAEYRVGGSHIEYRRIHNDSPPIKPKSKSRRYTIGETEDEEEMQQNGGIHIHDEIYEHDRPLNDAIRMKKTNVAKMKTGNSNTEIKLSPKSPSESLFLPERDLLSKRRVTIAQDVHREEGN